MGDGAVIRRLARAALNAFESWRQRRRVERRNPELASLRKAEAERRKRHQPVRDIHKTRRAIVIENLRAETGAK